MLLNDRGFLGLKPPLTATVKQGHPLAQGMIACFLANEGGGPIRDLITGQSIPLVNSGVWGNAQFGQGLDCSGGSDAGASTTAWADLRSISNEVTILWRGVVKVSPAAFSTFIGVTYTNSDTAPFWAYNLGVDNTGKIELAWNNSGSLLSLIQSPLSAFDSTERQFVGTIRATAGILAASNLYEGPGISLGSAGTTTINVNYATSQIGIGVYQTGIGRNSNTVFRHGIIWNRALSQAEVQELFYHPYIFLESKYKRYFVPGPATSPFNETISDTLPAWTEFLQVNNNQAANFGVIKNDYIQLLDALSLQGPPPNYYFVVGDRLNLTDFESQTEGYPLKLSDLISLSDSIAWWIVVLQSFSDALALADHLQAIPGGLFLKIADTLPTFLDSISKAKGLGVSGVSNNFTFGDNLTLSDSFKAQFNTFLQLSDQLNALLESLGITFGDKLGDSMSLSDSVTILLTAFPSVSATVSDTFSFSDSVKTGLNLPWLRLTETASDTLSLTDSVSVASGLPYNEPGFTTRLRRYLNDLN